MSADSSPSTGPLATEVGRHALLQAIVEMTRSVFAARACSMMSHDPATRELVFEAVAGEGAELVGHRMAASTGLAGWALASEEPIAISDVRKDPRFAREIAEQTGYVPTSMSVHPLLYEERSVGVLSVLDQGAVKQVGLADMDVLARIAGHAATVLALVQAEREAETAGPRTGALAGVERALASASAPRREAALTMLAGLERLLEND